MGEHLVGRSEACDVFEHALEEIDRGQPAAVALMGEPGIGKTRLLGELSARADTRGHLVLYGSASELERDLPFWLFVDALDEYLQGLRRVASSTGRRHAVPTRPCLSLALSVRDERTAFPARALPQLPRRARAARAANRPQAVVARTRRSHWADRDPWSCSAALLRRAAGRRCAPGAGCPTASSFGARGLGAGTQPACRHAAQRRCGRSDAGRG